MYIQLQYDDLLSHTYMYSRMTGGTYLRCIYSKMTGGTYLRCIYSRMTGGTYMRCIYSIRYWRYLHEMHIQYTLLEVLR